MDSKERPASSEGTYPPELYAGLHRGSPGDVDFYRRVCAGADSVLELGCGYGRVLSALAADGYRTVGLEQDEGLAAMARQAAEPFGATVVLGDMCDFDLGERFDRVIIPFNGIYCLLTPEAVVACFRQARAHLAEGGLVVFDGYAADAFHTSSSPEDMPEDQLSPVGIVEALGHTYDVFEQSRWEPERQRLEAIYLHIARDGSPTVTCTIPQRYMLSDEAPELLAAAGLEPWVVHGGFDQSAFDEDSELLIVTARATDEPSA